MRATSKKMAWSSPSFWGCAWVYMTDQTKWTKPLTLSTCARLQNTHTHAYTHKHTHAQIHSHILAYKLPSSRTMQGMESICVRAFAEALEVVPYTLAENAGLNPIQVCVCVCACGCLYVSVFEYVCLCVFARMCVLVCVCVCVPVCLQRCITGLGDHLDLTHIN